MPRREQIIDDDVFVVHELMTPTECDELIALSESHGFDDAPISTVGGPVMAPEIRNNERVMIDDENAADRLWQLAREFVPNELEERSAVGVNERLRFYRYTKGQTFNWHMDGHYQRENGQLSFLTYMIYLNEAFTGGETVFLCKGANGNPFELPVRPATGMALFFSHPLMHKGATVTDGCKYVLRTDVMYSAIS